MRKTELLFSSILIPIDYLMLVLAGCFVYYLRFSFTTFTDLRPVIYELAFSHFFISILLIALIWLGIFTLSGLYSLNEKRHFSKEFNKIFLACSVGITLIVFFIFFRREFFSSRFIVLAGWGISIVMVSLGRILIHLIRLFCYRHNKGMEPVLVFGHNKIAREIIQNIHSSAGFGYKVIGNPQNIDELFQEWLGQAGKINQLIQTDINLSKEDTWKLVDFCNEHQIIFKYVADVFGAIFSNVKSETLFGLPLIKIEKTSLAGWGRVAKRLVDIATSSFGLVFLSPLFLLIAFLIKIDSRGSVLVKLERIGERGKKIRIYKFRSMVKNASQMKKDLLTYNERKGPLFKMKNDPRITRLGGILRRTSLDEFPQLINVLIGEMSLVGPRPHEPEEVACYEKKDKQLLTIKPGITGLAQISGRSSLPFEEEAHLDLYYIERWNLLLDLQILIKTIPAVLGGQDAE